MVYNVNPGFINPGRFIVVVPQNSDQWLLKWYTPNFTAIWGLLIWGRHYNLYWLVVYLPL